MGIERRDYLLKKLVKLHHVLRKLLGLKRAAQRQEARQLLIDSFNDMLGLDAALVDALAVKDLMALLATGGEADPTKWIVAAALLAQRAELSLEEGSTPETETAAKSQRLKALELYLSAQRLAKKQPELDRMKKIKELVELLGRDQLPPDLARALESLN